MLTLINTNRMTPPIGPLGLEYIAGAAAEAGIDVGLADLCLAGDPSKALSDHFASHHPDLVGLSFRNVDDCFWPSGESFLPSLQQTVEEVRRLTDAPIVLGGVGFSIFAEELVRRTGADFGIRGDGEEATVMLHDEVLAGGRFERVPGLLWRQGGEVRANPPAWPEKLRLPTARDAIDNAAYFRLGGQAGIETKRGCSRPCIYCADPLAKGFASRRRRPGEVAGEAESLADQGVDVLHLCDSEFNVPADHALAVCAEFIRRQLARRLRWYTYMAVVPFDAELAEHMRRAGCVGINFTGDAGCPAMLKTYRQRHGLEDLNRAVRLCRANGMAVMIDLLLGGPGETPETAAETINFIRSIDPDCAGAALGMRLYPGTAAAAIVAREAPRQTHPGVRRRYDGPVDLLWPTFYISPALGPKPARLVRELIAGDGRFFEPQEEAAGPAGAAGDHNYNDNEALSEAIRSGARGAYWDILRRLRPT